MAAPSRHACRRFLQLSKTIPSKRKSIRQPLSRCRPPTRPFATSIQRTAADSGYLQKIIRASEKAVQDLENEKVDEQTLSHARQVARRLQDPSQWRMPQNPITADDLESDERAQYDNLSQEDRQLYLGHMNHTLAEAEHAMPSESRMAAIQGDAAAFDAKNRVVIPYARTDPRELGWWGDDEEDELAQVEDDDDDWDESMMTSVAESQLELHREIRSYMRVTAWDMPLLNKFAKPFEAPTHKTPLRFRYTTYLGEHHPAQKKVVVQFSTKELQQSISLTEQQRIKLIKLVGVRYNPSTDTVRMSCEKFEHAAQNKRYLGDLVDKLVATAKDPSDMFEDIPLDFRHHKEKPKPQFPEEWKLTKRRVEELDILRQEPLKQLAAAEEATEAQRARENEQQRKIAEFVMAQPLGRREGSESERL